MSNLSLAKFRDNVKGNIYNRKQMVNMLSHFFEMDQETIRDKNLEKINILKQRLGVQDMTREEMILKGLIKPASNTTTNPLPTAQEECDIPEGKVITDLDVARKYIQLQDSARKRCKEFSLSLVDVRTLLKKKTCHYTGMKFSEEPNLKRTVDRIDNTKGYIKGNVVACTHIANQLKEMLVENKDSPFKGNTKALKKFINSL